jgi:hypothetical protein
MAIFQLDFIHATLEKRRKYEVFTALIIDRNGSPHGVSRFVEISVFYREAILQQILPSRFSVTIYFSL